MTLTPAKTLVDALLWRYATQKFDPARKIPDETWQALEQALVLAPSTFGIQPWKFVVVDDRPLREKLSAASFGQRQPVDCSHLVVFAAHKDLDPHHINRHVERTAEVRGVSKESLKGFSDAMVSSTDRARRAGHLHHWMARQVYIALGGFMTAAALLGVDTCPMEGLQPAKYDELLGLSPLGYTTVCVCPAGYRAADDKYADLPKVRFKDSDVFIRI